MEEVVQYDEPRIGEKEKEELEKLYQIPYPQILEKYQGNPLFWIGRAAYEVGENPRVVSFINFFKLWPVSKDLKELGIDVAKIRSFSAYGVTMVPPELLNRVSIYRYVRILAYSAILVPGYGDLKGSELFVCPVEIILHSVRSKNSDLYNYITKKINPQDINSHGLEILQFEANNYPELEKLKNIFPQFSKTKIQKNKVIDLITLGDLAQLDQLEPFDFEDSDPYYWIAEEDDLTLFNLVLSKFEHLELGQDYIFRVLTYSHYGSELFNYIMDQYPITQEIDTLISIFRYKSFTDFAGLAVIYQKLGLELVSRLIIGLKSGGNYCETSITEIFRHLI